MGRHLKFPRRVDFATILPGLFTTRLRGVGIVAFVPTDQILRVFTMTTPFDLDALLADHFDPGAIARGAGYVRKGFVLSTRWRSETQIDAEVRNEKGVTYVQSITFAAPWQGAQERWADGHCSCFVEFNCKHVVAALMVAAKERPKSLETSGATASDVSLWMDRMTRISAPQKVRAKAEPATEYTEKTRDRLLYVVDPHGPNLTVRIYKGRMAAREDVLGKRMSPYDIDYLLRGSRPPPGFVVQQDLELIRGLSEHGLFGSVYTERGGQTSYLARPPEPLGPLLEALCTTGRCLWDTDGNAALTWDLDRPRAELGWMMAADGAQSLALTCRSRPITVLCAADHAVWIDTDAQKLGMLEGSVGLDLLYALRDAPKVSASDAQTVAENLPPQIAGIALPRPRLIETVRRKPTTARAHLSLGSGRGRMMEYGSYETEEFPALKLRFSYEGQEVDLYDRSDPSVMEGDQVVTLTRDHNWESACLERLYTAGATLLEDVEFCLPSDALMAYDLVFADGHFYSEPEDALLFVDHHLSQLRAEGWDIVISKSWSFQISDSTAALHVETRPQQGDDFQGAGWFDLSFALEVDGAMLDMAPLVATALQRLGHSFSDGFAKREMTLKDVRKALAAQPFYVNIGANRYTAVDLSPLAPVLQMILWNQLELGASHASEATLAAQLEDALAGSDVSFKDSAGILPLARSLMALNEITAVQAPKGVHAKLRDYQGLGAAWMGELIAAGFGGVLADDMGLGKTLQVLTLLQARKDAGEIGPSLLFVPTSLLHSWQEQAARFTPELRFLILHGPDRHARADDIPNVDLVITTYALITRDRDRLCARDWPLVILDEAQTLKNPASQMAKTLRDIPSGGRLALTGTPLENSLQDLWTLMDWTTPGLLGDRKTFQTLFRKPIETQGDASAQARLNRRIRPFVLRRTKEEVASELPPKTEIIDYVELSRPQQQLYEAVRITMDRKVRDAVAAKGLSQSRITILDALLKLRQVCCDPALVKLTAARKVFESAKRERLMELLDELVREGRRVLVFSQFVKMLDLISGDLDSRGIAYVTLTGQTKDRPAVLDSFAKGAAPVFLLSLKAGGVGLTLTEADTVILYDPWWNPAVERQAMDRTHRIGQDKPIFVYRLVARGTVEEKIVALQAKKQALADALFEPANDKKTTDILDEETLGELFAPLEL